MKILRDVLRSVDGLAAAMRDLANAIRYSNVPRCSRCGCLVPFGSGHSCAGGGSSFVTGAGGGWYGRN